MKVSNMLSRIQGSAPQSGIPQVSGTAWQCVVCFLATVVFCFTCPNGILAANAASQPQDETAAIVSLVEGFNKTRDKRERAKYLEQLNGHKQHWEPMFLAASDRQLSLGGNEVLLPMLASPGKSVVPKIVELLTWNPDASLATAVQVTQRVGDEAIPSLLEQYKASASLLVRQYVAISVKNILARKDSKKPNDDELLKWALKWSSDKDEAIAESSIRIMHMLFAEDSSEKIEPVLKAKLTDAQRGVRLAAINVLAQVRAKADYVRAHVVTSALKSKDRIERDMNIRLCARLPVADDTLNVLYECSFAEDEQVRIAAAQALEALGPKSLPLADKMLKKLQEGNADSLPAIRAVLKHSKDNWDIIEKALVKLLSDKNSLTRCSCLGFLTSHATLMDDTTQKITDLLDDSDKQVRMLTIQALHPFIQKKLVQEAVANRREREGDKSVKQLLDMFMAEVGPTTQPK